MFFCEEGVETANQREGELFFMVLLGEFDASREAFFGMERKVLNFERYVLRERDFLAYFQMLSSPMVSLMIVTSMVVSVPLPIAIGHLSKSCMCYSPIDPCSPQSRRFLAYNKHSRPPYQVLSLTVLVRVAVGKEIGLPR